MPTIDAPLPERLVGAKRLRGLRLVGRCAALVVCCTLAVAGCSSSAPDAATRPSGEFVDVNDEWASIFAEHGVEGTFVLHRVGTDQVVVHGADRAAVEHTPASTFKVLNSLIALETGVVDDVDQVVPWDGVDRQVEAWNQDHTLRSAIEVSAVWAYQHVARAIGRERMDAAVRAAGYGNMDIGGPIDEFWLRGDLRISALQQVDFMTKLMTDQLPFEARHQAAVREILIRDRGDGWTWGHKTGTAVAADSVFGWLVGYTTTSDGDWVFAMNIDLGGRSLDGQIDPEVRLTLSRAVLEHAGALPAA